jgi:hypothetical protein
VAVSGVAQQLHSTRVLWARDARGERGVARVGFCVQTYMVVARRLESEHSSAHMMAHRLRRAMHNPRDGREARGPWVRGRARRPSRVAAWVVVTAAVVAMAAGAEVVAADAVG